MVGDVLAEADLFGEVAGELQELFGQLDSVEELTEEAVSENFAGTAHTIVLDSYDAESGAASFGIRLEVDLPNLEYESLDDQLGLRFLPLELTTAYGDPIDIDVNYVISGLQLNYDPTAETPLTMLYGGGDELVLDVSAEWLDSPIEGYFGLFLAELTDQGSYSDASFHINLGSFQSEELNVSLGHRTLDSALHMRCGNRPGSPRDAKLQV